jgi:prefoldin subunit 5
LTIAVEFSEVFMAGKESIAQHEDVPESGSQPGDDVHANANAPRMVNPGMTEARTSDRGVVAPPSSYPPTQAVRYQTSQQPSVGTEDPIGTGGVEPADRDKDASARRHRAKGRNSGEENHGRRHGRWKQTQQDRRSRKFPTWQMLLVTGAMAIVCGGAGAWGYSRFLESDKSGRHAKDSSKDDQGAKSGSQKSDALESDQGSASESLKKQLQQLADGMDDLGARIERLNKATQEARIPVAQYYPGTSRIERMTTGNGETPAMQHSSQAQLTVLQRKVEELAGLSARVQELERRMNELEESKTSSPETSASE